MLNTPLELINCPVGTLLRLLILKLLTLDSFGHLIGNILRIAWHWEFNCDSCSKVVGREAAPDFESKLKFEWGLLINEWVNSEGSRIFTIDAVVHHEELTIWRRNSQCLHCFKVF